ncbi:hypothetical protein ACXZ1K_02205 [Pedobacter sp. PWIIR3]
MICSNLSELLAAQVVIAAEEKRTGRKVKSLAGWRVTASGVFIPKQQRDIPDKVRKLKKI